MSLLVYIIVGCVKLVSNAGYVEVTADHFIDNIFLFGGTLSLPNHDKHSIILDKTQ